MASPVTTQASQSLEVESKSIEIESQKKEDDYYPTLDEEFATGADDTIGGCSMVNDKLCCCVSR